MPRRVSRRLPTEQDETVRRAVFVDTSVWYAMLDGEDPKHAVGLSRLRRTLESRRSLITTNHVVGETYTLARGRVGFRIAYGFLERVRSDPLIRRIFVPEAWEDEAERLLHQY